MQGTGVESTPNVSKALGKHPFCLHSCFCSFVLSLCLHNIPSEPCCWSVTSILFSSVLFKFNVHLHYLSGARTSICSIWFPYDLCFTSEAPFFLMFSSCILFGWHCIHVLMFWKPINIIWSLKKIRSEVNFFCHFLVGADSKEHFYK